MFHRSPVVVGIVGALCLLPVLNISSASNAAPIFKNKVLQLTVIAKNTKKPIANLTVTINSDNGIRCIKAPCPNNSIQWKGQTNRQGVVVIPHKIIQKSTTMTVPGYQAIQLQPSLRDQRSASVELSAVAP
jgi:hypothetical protein